MQSESGEMGEAVQESCPESSGVLVIEELSVGKEGGVWDYLRQSSSLVSSPCWLFLSKNCNIYNSLFIQK